jgi:hypothetical protein
MSNSDFAELGFMILGLGVLIIATWVSSLAKRLKSSILLPNKEGKWQGASSVDSWRLGICEQIN